MNRRVLVDTGPLVAVLSSTDAHHSQCVELFKQIEPPLLTCWPVITEAAWLLRTRPDAVGQLLGGFENGLLKLLLLDETAIPTIGKFLRRYEKLGAQLADACLAHLAERERLDTVFTLDRRDFSVYRIAGKSLRLLPEL